MTSKQQWLVVLGIVAVLVGGAVTASHFLKDELTSVSVGSDAPGFAAKIDVDAEALLERTQHGVVLARQFHRYPVGNFHRVLSHYIDSDSVVPPITCQCRWNTLCSASGPWLVVTR